MSTRNKDAEPSSTAYIIVKIQSIIAFALTVFIVWMIAQQIVL